MTDCPNAEMRDRLPDLLHERLEKSVRAAVMAHVDQCEDCRAEMTLLRDARSALSPAVPAIDVAAISRAVIETTRAVEKAGSRRSPWTGWQVAASVALLVVGAASVALLVRSPHTASRVATIADTRTALPNAPRPEPVVAETIHRSGASPIVTAAGAELSAAASVSDLSEGELRALLRELDQIDAVPLAEPEQVNVRIPMPAGGSSE